MNKEDIKDIIRGACEGTNNVTFQQLEDALVHQAKFGGIPVFYAKKEVVEGIRKVQIDSLLEQVEKLKKRRDNWRRRYEEASRNPWRIRVEQAINFPMWPLWICVGYTVTDIITAFIP